MINSRNIALILGLLVVGSLLYFLSNNSGEVGQYRQASNFNDSLKSNSVSRAKYFDLFLNNGGAEIVIRGRDFQERKRLYFQSNEWKGQGSASVICLSSVYVGYLQALGLDVNIVGVDDLGNVSNKIVKSNSNVVELGHSSNVNKELLYSLKPDYILLDDFNLDREILEGLEVNGTTIIPCNSFREEDPLARAEWVKLFGALFNKVEEANQIYNGIESRYMNLLKLTHGVVNRPTVFLNSMWGDQWTIPGAKSFQAYLLDAAGADYLKKNDSSNLTIHVGMEYMLSKASSLDYWLNSGNFTSLSSLVESNENYLGFNSVKNKKVFNNNKGVNKDGGIPYWETSGVEPDVVLSDLIHIFHPHLLPHHELKYYQKLN